VGVVPSANPIAKGSSTISNILNGKADPSFSTLDKLAKALGVSLEKLHADRPVLKSMRFRTNKSLTAREKAAKDTLPFTVFEKLNIYKNIEKYLPPHTTIDFSAYPSTPEEAARKLRQDLQVSSDAPVTSFCNKLASIGVKQFYFNFGLSKTFGISVNKEDGGPAIFVNTGTANVERWIFTIFHELGHIILQPESYDGKIQTEDEHSSEEAEANLFAAEFLLPSEVVREKVKGTKDFSFIRKVLEIKQEFSVSYKLVLMQYCRAYGRKEQDVMPKFQKMCGNYIHHDFVNHYEPNALPKDRFKFEDPNFRDCVFGALKNKDMDIDVAANLLNESEDSIEKELEFFSATTSTENLPF